MDEIADICGVLYVEFSEIAWYAKSLTAIDELIHRDSLRGLFIPKALYLFDLKEYALNIVHRDLTSYPVDRRI
jgi:hypothetical protein